MLSVTTKLEQKGDAKAALEKVLRELKWPQRMVKVGFPAGKAPGSIIHIAYWNHEGTSRKKGDVFFRNGKFGISGPIPSRPFITVAVFNGRPQIREEMRKSVAAIIRGERTMDQAMMRLGTLGQFLIQAQIAAGMGPPNSAMTIMLKGSAQPLNDTGAMGSAVTWALDQ